MVRIIICAIAVFIVDLSRTNAWAAPDDDPCPTVGCGSNAPHLTEHHLVQLNLDAEQNSFGARLGHLLQDGLRYRLAIEDGAFVGHRPGGPAIAGPALVGAEVVITRTNDAGKERHRRILIADYRAVRYWDGTERAFPVYHLKVKKPGDGTWGELCHHPPGIDVGEGLEQWSSPVVGRYDYREMAPIAGSRERGWFNIACAGQAFFKMKRHGYDDDRYSDDQRQATLRMITAAYCPGDSWNYTLYGASIYWQNQAGDIVFGSLPLNSEVSRVSGALGGVEAVWTKDGAACLSMPRVPKAEREIVLKRRDVASGEHASTPCGAGVRKAIGPCDVRAGDSLSDVLARHGGEWITVTPNASSPSPTPPLRPRSGCAGCTLGGTNPGAGGAWLVALLIAAAWQRIRRRRSVGSRAPSE